MVLAVLPVAVFAVPALAGHLVVPGDDLIQNLPLRVLVGDLIRHGHLPLLDPYIWGGAPLLAGWNAGAAYPLTWLFAVLPGSLAWSANLVVTWWVAGIGGHLFLRTSRLSAPASFLGAFSFVFGGAMISQVSHLGLVAGMSWVPLQLLVLLRLSAPLPGRRRLRAVLLLGVLGALTVLAGEPRAIADAAVTLTIYATWRWWRSAARRGYLASLAAAAGLAALLSAVQWLPGIDAVGVSQRAGASYALFAYGSLPIRWLTLLVVPSLLGGSGSLGAAAFVGGFNFVEVTGYVGLAPLTAMASLLVRVRCRARLPEWAVWFGVALAGTVLALGGETPLGPVLARLPLYGSQRLQGRNLVELDLALAVLLAYGVDTWIRHPVVDPAIRRLGRSIRALVPLLPGSAAVGLCVWGLLSADSLLPWLGHAGPHRSPSGGYAADLVPSIVLGVACVALVVLGRRRSGSWRRRAVTSFVVVDLVVFAVTSVVAVGSSPASADGAVPVHTTGVEGVGTRAAAALTVPGRFAIYDPGLVDVAALNAIGEPDRNILSGGYSVQGYGSIVEGGYAAATGTHRADGGGQDALSLSAIAGGTLDQLDTSVLLTPAASLVNAAPGASTDGGDRVAEADREVVWYLGSPTQLTSVSIPVRSGNPSGARIGLETAGGRIAWQRATVGPFALDTRVAPAGPIVAVVVGRTGGAGALRLGPAEATTSRGRRILADGALQGALLAPHWAYDGTDGPFAVYRDRDAEPGIRLLATAGRSLAGASVRIVSGPPAGPSSVVVTSRSGAVVVRAVAAAPGWQASWTATGGQPMGLQVDTSGVVQAVTVPPGTGLLTWQYDPPGVGSGLLLSGTGLALLVAGTIGSASRRRRPWRLGPVVAEPT